MTAVSDRKEHSLQSSITRLYLNSISINKYKRDNSENRPTKEEPDGNSNIGGKLSRNAHSLYVNLINLFKTINNLFHLLIYAFILVQCNIIDKPFI